jgi:phosphoribosylanthranilate isomerase
MGVRVKICGITSAEAADAAVRARADLAGFVFHAPSSRNLRFEQASAMARQVRGRIRVVALMADPSDEQVAAVAQAVAPDYFQLHGRETPARVGELVTRFRIPAIKGFGVAEAADLANVAAYNDVAEMFLFDAKAPASAATPGGHGVAFDWQLLKGRKFARPWLLAGGLDAGNVARAIAAAEAPGVDVSSGVESAPGVKDAERIRAFVDAARGARIADQTTEKSA